MMNRVRTAAGAAVLFLCGSRSGQLLQASSIISGSFSALRDSGRLCLLTFPKQGIRGNAENICHMDDHIGGGASFPAFVVAVRLSGAAKLVRHILLAETGFLSVIL